MRAFFQVRRVALALLLGFASALPAWSPGSATPGVAGGFVVDPNNRLDVLSFYQTVYRASENYPATMGWTGSVQNGNPGTTTMAFKEDVRRRINFYRALSGLPADISFDAVKSAKDQEAALLFARNGQLSHSPPSTWTYYTASAYEAAGASNIALGYYGPSAVDAFLRDDGSNNILVGHRRWLQYSQAKTMGTGDVPAQAPYNSANAIWVIGDFKTAPSPRFVAWPNRGYVPASLAPARWSLSYPNANFAAAAVTMSKNGNSVAATIISNNDNGYGDNTLVWTPAGFPATVNADTPYAVTVSGISGGGIPASYNYTVTLFDPNVLQEAATITGTNTPPVTGAAYTFNAINQADSYELVVATGSPAAWTEGAEDSPTPQVAPFTTGTYPLRQSALVRTGSKAFQLVFPTGDDQGFVITRDLIPTASSNLQFYDRGRFATTTTTLHAEISTDGGYSWTSLWQRQGVGGYSSLWDPAFIARSISLAAYSGQIVRLRFIMRSNGQSINTGTSPNSGFFIDDISVTSATQLAGSTTTALPARTSSFTLNEGTAGAPLTAGILYYMRIRPNVGTRWFGYGPAKMVTTTGFPPSGYAAWVSSQFPPVTGGPTGDPDRDNLTNGVEYAFGLNPTVANPGSDLPQPVRVGATYGVSFTQPAGISGVTYAAQWSRNLTQWFPVPDTGTGDWHNFSVIATGEPEVFFRYQITVAP